MNKRSRYKLSISLLSIRYIFVFAIYTLIQFALQAESHARPLRLLSLPVEASSESNQKQKALSSEERIYLAEALALQFVTASAKQVIQIKSSELNDLMSKSSHLLDHCGSACPQKLAQLAQADLIIQARMFRFGGQWRMLVSISDSQDNKLIEDKLKGSVEQIEAQLTKQAANWFKNLSPTIQKLSKTPLRMYYIQQANTVQTKRWQSLGLTWLPISGAKFEMGSSKGHPNERPIHQVEVQDFQMMKTEVTASQYWACVEAGVCSPTPEKDGCALLSALSREAVNCVTWSQAQDFAQWIGARLPTEAEWALAAKGKEHRTYPWGEAEASCEYLSFLDQDGREGCGESEVQSPCQYPKGMSPEGLCDLAGNLWEWVADDWHRSYQNAPSKGVWCDQALQQGQCPTKPRGLKTYRGGSWYHSAKRARSSSRAGGAHDTISVGIGFRCVL